MISTLVCVTSEVRILSLKVTDCSPTGTFTANGLSGVSAGHYTAYAKNPRTDVWYYYNDEITSRQKPQDEDFSNAYILFYSRQGTNLKPCNI